MRKGSKAKGQDSRSLGIEPRCLEPTRVFSECVELTIEFVNIGAIVLLDLAVTGRERSGGIRIDWVAQDIYDLRHSEIAGHFVLETADLADNVGSFPERVRLLVWLVSPYDLLIRSDRLLCGENVVDDPSENDGPSLEDLAGRSGRPRVERRSARFRRRIWKGVGGGEDGSPVLTLWDPLGRREGAWLQYVAVAVQT